MTSDQEGSVAVDESVESSLAPAVTRAARVLSILADARGVPQSLAEISRALGAAKSSTSNICSVLEESGLIRRRETGYVLGRRTVELGGAYLATFDQVREFYRITAESEVLSHELCQLAVLDGTQVLYLARHEGHAPLRITAGIGDRLPASITAVGNALLSTLRDGDVRERFSGVEMPRMTERSTTDVDALVRKLDLTRARGYALDEGEVFPNVVGLAMVVPPRNSGESKFALGVSTFDSPSEPVLSAEHRERVLAAMTQAVKELSNPMSGQGLSSAS